MYWNKNSIYTCWLVSVQSTNDNWMLNFIQFISTAYPYATTNSQTAMNPTANTKSPPHKSNDLFYSSIMVWCKSSYDKSVLPFPTPFCKYDKAYQGTYLVSNGCEVFGIRYCWYVYSLFNWLETTVHLNSKRTSQKQDNIRQQQVSNKTTIFNVLFFIMYKHT